MTYLTGFHAMEEALRSGSAKGASLLVAAAGPRIKRIMEQAAKSGVDVKKIQSAELDQLAPDNRGAALAVESAVAPKEIDLARWCGDLSAEHSLVLILDHIEDPRNYGAILRSADVFAADLVIVPDKRAASQTDAVSRTAAGATAWVPVAEVTNLARALELLKEVGFWTYAADMGGQDLPGADLPGRVALVLGAEGSGVSRLLRERCDGLLSIPQHGHVDSLNVSVAAGIFLYELRRRLGAPAHPAR